MPERDANQLAADFKRRVEACKPRYRELNSPLWGVLTEAVALVGTLQQDRDAERRWCKHWAERAEAAEAALATTRQALAQEVDKARIGSQIALCEELIRAAHNDETFGVEDINAKLILLMQAER